MNKQPVYKRLAILIDAYHRCIETKNTEWEARHLERIRAIEKRLPSGSGIDHGTTIDLERSSVNRLVLTLGFHHINEGGYYDGWTEHTLYVHPNLAFTIDLRISGRDRNNIKEYLHQVYHAALMELEE